MFILEQISNTPRIITITWFIIACTLFFLGPYVLPAAHPDVSALWAPILPAWHKNLDDIVKNGIQLPLVHPVLEDAICRYDLMAAIGAALGPSGCVGNLTWYHSNIDILMSSNYTLPVNHPLVSDMLGKLLPSWHTNLDYILANGITYPPKHPNIDSYICRIGEPISALLANGCIGSISVWHSNVDTLLTNSYTYPPGHLKVNDMLAYLLPPGHPNADDIMKAGTQFPSWHPLINEYICKRTWSAGNYCV